jgi:chemotaxis signal transduction protein
VLAIGADQFEPTPRCVASGDVVTGLATCKDRVLILLDVDRVVGELDPAALDQGR